MRYLFRELMLMNVLCLLCIALMGCARKDQEETPEVPAEPVQAYQIVENLIGEQQNCFISVLSFKEDEIEAFVTYPYGSQDQEGEPVDGQGEYIEQIEILHIMQTDEEWETVDIQNGIIYTDYFDTDMSAQIRQNQDEATGMSEKEAQDIAAGLYEQWADFYNRFLCDTMPGAESYPGEEYEDYVVYPKELFSSLADMRIELEQIMTSGCVEQFWNGWIMNKERPYYIERDGVLYRYDTGSPVVIMEADRFILQEYTEEKICVYAIEKQSEYESLRSVFKMTIVHTEEGWRIGQLDHGSVDRCSDLE